MTIDGLPSGLSRFGTPSTPVEKTAGWLRAKASGSGMELHAASQVDLTAACLGADAWILVYGASRPEVGLDTPRRAGKQAVAAAAAIFARACGLGGESTVDPSLEDLDQSTIDKWLPTAEGLTQWARAQIGDTAAATALRYAASDLCAAGERSPAAAFASLLVACADTLLRGEDR
jgi:hypothetical protein